MLQRIITLARGVGSRMPTRQTESLLPELAAIGCFLMLPWIGITVALHFAHDSAEAGAVQASGTLAQALEESTRRTIGQIDTILLSARALRAARNERFDFDDWARSQTWPDRMTVQIAMADRNGLIVGSTLPLAAGASIADREHFQIQADPEHDTLYIGPPLIGRTSGRQSIRLSRKLLDPNGAFAGVVVFSLSTVELAHSYEALGLGRGFVSILASDGTILARGPWIPGLVGTSMRGKAGFNDVMSHITGSIGLHDTGQVPQIVSFRRVQDYPLIVMVGFDADTVFAPYRSLRANALLSGIAVTFAVGLIGFFWLRQKRRNMLSRRALTVTLDTISQGVLMVDGQGGVSVINPRVLDLLAWPDEKPDAAMKFVVARATELIPGNADGGSAESPDSRFETSLENGTIIEVQTHLLADGGFVQTYTDITVQRLAHAQVEHLAHHDALTGLANRVGLRRRVSELVDQTAGPAALTALIMIDLDGFKGINDTLGHDAGDLLLVEVGARLTELVRPTDVVARLGGDEFVILITGLEDPMDVVPLAQRVLRRLADPTQVHNQLVRVGASMGLAFHPRDGLDVDTLFKHADMALYSAKTGGRGTYRCFDQQLTRTATEHRLLERELSRALDADGLEVHFQPKFNAVSLEIVGFEALARWRHPTRGYVPPDVFIRIAEQCGLINRLGLWVLQQACRCVATWQPRFPVAVNVSLLQLHDNGLTEMVAAVLKQTGLEPRQLEFEVTESVLADDDQTVLGNLQAIKAMGIRIALDDFGTGYSSLSYLRRFRFDKIKIDKSFVQGRADDPDVHVILEAILGLCHNLGLATIAEGVETPDQLVLLRDRGCTEIQGYLLGRPMHGDRVQDFIATYRRPAGEPVVARGGDEPCLIAS